MSNFHIFLYIDFLVLGMKYPRSQDSGIWKLWLQNYLNILVWTCLLLLYFRQNIILFSGPAWTFHHHTSQNVAQHLAMYTGGDRKMFVTFQHGHTNWANLCLDNRDIGYQMDQQQDCSTDVAMITDKFTELYSGKNSFYLLDKSKHCVSRHQLGRQFCLWVSCNGHWARLWRGEHYHSQPNRN